MIPLVVSFFVACLGCVLYFAGKLKFNCSFQQVGQLFCGSLCIFMLVYMMTDVILLVKHRTRLILFEQLLSYFTIYLNTYIFEKRVHMRHASHLICAWAMGLPGCTDRSWLVFKGSLPEHLNKVAIHKPWCVISKWIELMLPRIS